MLTIYVPLPEGHRYPNDSDAWFLESLSEMIDEALLPLGASVGGFETGPDEVGLCVFGADPKTMATELVPLLKRHCPAGTYLNVFYDEDEDGTSEDILLFRSGEAPVREPIPVTSPEHAYRPVDLTAPALSSRFAEDDRYIFKAIASSPGLSLGDINSAMDAMERIRLEEQALKDGIDRLQKAGYVRSDAAGLQVAPRIAGQLPRTAKGNVSSYRREAWDRVFEALF